MITYQYMLLFVYDLLYIRYDKSVFTWAENNVAYT